MRAFFLSFLTIGLETNTCNDRFFSLLLHTRVSPYHVPPKRVISVAAYALPDTAVRTDRDKIVPTRTGGRWRSLSRRPGTTRSSRFARHTFRAPENRSRRGECKKSHRCFGPAHFPTGRKMVFRSAGEERVNVFTIFFQDLLLLVPLFF